MLKLVGTFTQVTEGTTLLAGMQGWFDKVEEHEQKISGFGYTDITMDTQVGATTVPDITGMNYIPVILRVSVAYDGLGVYGMASQNKWVVECKRVQNITIRFFKYPI